MANIPADREVDSRGNCSKCGGTHYGSRMCPILETPQGESCLEQTTREPEPEAERRTGESPAPLSSKEQFKRRDMLDLIYDGERYSVAECDERLATIRDADLDVAQARQLRDWLNSVLPDETPEPISVAYERTIGELRAALLETSLAGQRLSEAAMLALGRSSEKTSAPPVSGDLHYVEELVGGRWQRCALAHMWETEDDARRQLLDLQSRYGGQTTRQFRLHSPDTRTREP